MKIVKNILATVACAICAWITLLGMAPMYSAAGLTVRPSEYFGIAYAAPPIEKATYLFFADEPIKLDLRITNGGVDSVSVTSVAPSPAGSFRITRGQNVDFVIENSLRKERLGGTVPVDWARTIQIDPHESLIFHAEHAGAFLAAGEYVIEWETTIHDTNGLTIAPQSTRFQFEVRASVAETRAEEARRSASRAFVAGDDRLVEHWIGALLQANPGSYLAHALRAEVAVRARNPQRALESYAMALQMLNTNTDEQFRRWSDPRHRLETVEGLKARIRAHGGQP